MHSTVLESSCSAPEHLLMVIKPLVFQFIYSYNVCIYRPARLFGQVWWNDGLGLHIGRRWHARENEWHRCKQHEHSQIGDAGNRIAAGDIFTKRSTLESDGKHSSAASSSPSARKPTPRRADTFGGKANRFVMNRAAPN